MEPGKFDRKRILFLLFIAIVIGAVIGILPLDHRASLVVSVIAIFLLCFFGPIWATRGFSIRWRD